MKPQYLKRTIEKQIEKKLQIVGAVQIIGPKFCGKTTTAIQYSNSFINLSEGNNARLAEEDSFFILNGEKPRVIDEWQIVPSLWDDIRNLIDKDSSKGSFILTGSSTPVNVKQIYHSGAGRIAPLKMRTMSLFESFESSGVISLKKLFDEGWKPEYSQENKNFNLQQIAFYICRGGWPESVLQKNCELSLDLTRTYYDKILDFGNFEWQKFRKVNKSLLDRLVKSYARNISTSTPLTTILEDVTQSLGYDINLRTLKKYADVLTETFVVEDLPAWNPNYRSKVAMRTVPVHHFTDPSIACCALELSPNGLLQDLETFGFLFEDFVLRDLKIYTESIGGNVFHYHERRGLECDAVINLNDGRFCLIEIKLGSLKGVSEGIASLLKIEKRFSGENRHKPQFLMVITAKGPAYKTSEGVYVVPINFLRD
ncbi:ATP-binding protein [[Mycoplasma] testudinis]|uniref:ATP-binding protein n=1 Tax=[Mycoplasma] testudinis TaxID=33924 RepID=UPI000486544A|nr:DUF4143 domain-containing protein [[Mycoplasma] testudinis]